MRTEFFRLLDAGNRFLVAGAGGGFDFVSGVPLFLHLRRAGKTVVLANLSFTDLGRSGAVEENEGAWHIVGDVAALPYFPERHVGEWLAQRGEDPVIYAFSSESGVRPLRRAYASVIARHGIDTIVLVDGGTDSLMRGDEARVGTIVEDACSLAAVAPLLPDRSFLSAIGFGVEHDLNHHACLENIASLSAQGHFLGAESLTDASEEGRAFLELVDHLNRAMPDHRSIVINSIAAAMRGSFGDHHATDRTAGTDQFVSPLMNVAWYFRLGAVADRILFRESIESSATMEEVAKAYHHFRLLVRPRPRGTIPLR
jgi:hypothetical protein